MAAAALSILRAQVAAGIVPLLIIGAASAFLYAYEVLRPVPLMMAAGGAYCLLTTVLGVLGA
jgi:hypothetical protein